MRKRYIVIPKDKGPQNYWAKPFALLNEFVQQD